MQLQEKPIKTRQMLHGVSFFLPLQGIIRFICSMTGIEKQDEIQTPLTPVQIHLERGGT